MRVHARFFFFIVFSSYNLLFSVAIFNILMSGMHIVLEHEHFPDLQQLSLCLQLCCFHLFRQ